MNGDFVDEYEGGITLSTVPIGQFIFRRHFYLEVTVLDRIEGEGMFVYLVRTVLSHDRIFLCSHFAEVLSILGCRYGKAAGIEYPVSFLHTGRDGDTAHFCRLFQVDNGLHIVAVESNPTAGLVVVCTFHSVEQGSGSLVSILLVDGLHHLDGLETTLVNFDFFGEDAAVACRTDGDGFQCACLFQFQRSLVLG